MRVRDQITIFGPFTLNDLCEDIPLKTLDIAVTVFYNLVIQSIMSKPEILI